ncbi:septum site-determining protein Ssd [Actinokineospora iranica]|uniref:Helicase/secretion neighborhood CpaE-like protein n=1 Tax=Actinokineospora iranica TaxID=1271860 RepID=A0A1G6XXA0_9PSEU|nr:septum site-determining protein Ssd [Actinokineospora iranica]SDD82006.1 helicase/secretion neighborhood CpaE-like protein [Actinokineospora iranica]
MPRPLICVHDDALLDDVLRLAAAAGAEIHRAADVTEIRAHWHDAPLILLDAQAAAACQAAALPRRDSVVLATAGPPPPTMWERAVALGAEHVVALPDAETWLVGALADATEAPASTTGKVLAVIGGRGGAGASVFAAAVALTALDLGHNALLVDCDPLSGGLDLVLGAEDHPGLRWPDLRLKAGRVPISSLHASLPGRTKASTRLTLLSTSRDGEGPTPEAVAAILDAGKRAGETVVCDLPRTPDPAARAALDRADLTVIIVPAELRATAATKRVATHLTTRGIRAALVVRGPSPARLRPQDIATAVGLPLLATLRSDPSLVQALDHGTFHLRPRSPLSRAARTVLRALAHPTHPDPPPASPLSPLASPLSPPGASSALPPARLAPPPAPPAPVATQLAPEPAQPALPPAELPPSPAPPASAPAHSASPPAQLASWPVRPAFLRAELVPSPARLASLPSRSVSPRARRASGAVSLVSALARAGLPVAWLAFPPASPALPLTQLASRSARPALARAQPVPPPARLPSPPVQFISPAAQSGVSCAEQASGLVLLAVPPARLAFLPSQSGFPRAQLASLLRCPPPRPRGPLLRSRVPHSPTHSVWTARAPIPLPNRSRAAHTHRHPQPLSCQRDFPAPTPSDHFHR